MLREKYRFSFLLEMLICIFFFILSATLCIQLYARANQMNSEANEKKELLEYAENYIESTSHYEIKDFYLDENCKEIKKGIYHVVISYSNSKHLYQMKITKKNHLLLNLSFYKEEL